MTKKVRIVQFLGLLLYTIVSAVVLLVAQASYLVSAIVLLLAPTIIIWQQLDLRTRLIPIAGLLAVVITIVVQLYAYVHGLWYEVTPSDIWLLSLVPLESLLFGSLLILYYVLLYEYFFDDQIGRVKTTYVAQMIGLVMSLLAVMIGYVLIAPEPLFSKPYLYLVGVLLGMLVLIVGVKHSATRVKIMKRGLFFSLAIFPLSFIGEMVLLINNGRFFANLPEYAYVFSVFGYAVPLEEFLGLLLFPWWIVVVYELLLDDGK